MKHSKGMFKIRDKLYFILVWGLGLRSCYGCVSFPARKWRVHDPVNIWWSKSHMRTFGEGRDRLSFQSARCVLSSRRLHLAIWLQWGWLGLITQLNNIIDGVLTLLILYSHITLKEQHLLQSYIFSLYITLLIWSTFIRFSRCSIFVL